MSYLCLEIQEAINFHGKILITSNRWQYEGIESLLRNLSKILLILASVPQYGSREQLRLDCIQFLITN